MSIIDCQFCGGTHWGSVYCPYTDKGKAHAKEMEEWRERLKEQKNKMDIQYYPDELDYASAKLRENPRASSFLNQFLESCVRADAQNYELIRPALQAFMKKYPVRVKA